jgi:16S rRNA (guanine966-N2)-methyltransferase
MRIIAGEHRGRRIQAPEGESTRPMLDRVREALFGTLGARVEGARVLDLFAGSGSLALEALSRGAATARLIEGHRRTLALLRANIEQLELRERAEAVLGDALAPKTWSGKDARYELIFMDPPYPMLENGRERPRVLAALAELASAHLAEDGMLVLHAPRGTLRAEDFRPAHAESRDYGTNTLWYVSAPRDGGPRTQP